MESKPLFDYIVFFIIIVFAFSFLKLGIYIGFIAVVIFIVWKYLFNSNQYNKNDYDNNYY